MVSSVHKSMQSVLYMNDLDPYAAMLVVFDLHFPVNAVLIRIIPTPINEIYFDPIINTLNIE